MHGLTGSQAVTGQGMSRRQRTNPAGQAAGPGKGRLHVGCTFFFQGVAGGPVGRTRSGFKLGGVCSCRLQEQQPLSDS